MEQNALDGIGRQLEADARSWIEQEKPRELLYKGEQFDLAKEWVRQHAVSVEAWEFFEACMINSLRYFALGWAARYASFELRTPLTSIRGYSSLLLEEYSEGLEPEQILWLKCIDSNAKNLSDLFNYAQEEAEKFDGRQHPDQ